jgi:hypothetical protein
MPNRAAGVADDVIICRHAYSRPHGYITIPRLRIDSDELREHWGWQRIGDTIAGVCNRVPVEYATYLSKIFAVHAVLYGVREYSLAKMIRTALSHDM